MKFTIKIIGTITLLGFIGLVPFADICAKTLSKQEKQALKEKRKAERKAQRKAQRRAINLAERTDRTAHIKNIEKKKDKWVAKMKAKGLSDEKIAKRWIKKMQKKQQAVAPVQTIATPVTAPVPAASMYTQPASQQMPIATEQQIATTVVPSVIQSKQIEMPVAEPMQTTVAQPVQSIQQPVVSQAPPTVSIQAAVQQAEQIAPPPAPQEPILPEFDMLEFDDLEAFFKQAMGDF